MPRRLSEYRLFFGEFLRNYHTTGAILPSGRRLGAALARYVAEGDAPKRILEVGPGTGAVTRHIVANLPPHDRLDLVELNGAFTRRLREDFRHDRALRAVAERVRVLESAVEDLPRNEPYDVIISGLPLNNFSAESVGEILGAFRELLAPGGTLSFFQYIAIRPARALVSRREDRRRLRGIGYALATLLDGHEIRREWIWPNVPPAWVHHVRFQ